MNNTQSEVKKTYDLFPNINDIIFFYEIENGIDCLPRIIRVDEDSVFFEYICGNNGYELNCNQFDLINVLCDLVKKLSVKASDARNIESLLYSKRIEYMYRCSKTILETKCGSEFLSNEMIWVVELIDSMYNAARSVWDKEFKYETFYFLHGDLHPGNMIRKENTNSWIAIDPIVTCAPLEFDFVRFIENYTYHIIEDNLQTNTLSLKNTVFFEKTVTDYANKIIKRTNNALTLSKIFSALFIDSLLRAMETIIEYRDDTRFMAKIRTSIEYCCKVKQLVKVDL